MTEAEALAWTDAQVSRGTLDQLRLYRSLLEAESSRHNLVAASSLPCFWSRHVVDSLQLLRHAPDGEWIDIGSGAGLPGLVVAIAGRSPVVMVEPRTLRAGFLSAAAIRLGLSGAVTVVPAKVTMVMRPPARVLSARAVAPLDVLFAAAGHLADDTTHWLLPKGRTVHKELAEARRSWQGEFRLEPSLTDPDARIVIATQVKRKGSR